MSSTPGHHQIFEGIGDITLVQKGVGGAIAGVLVAINVGEPLQIAVLSTKGWPAGLCQGARLWFKGYLGHERLTHRKNLHFVQAHHVALITRRETHE